MNELDKICSIVSTKLLDLICLEDEYLGVFSGNFVCQNCTDILPTLQEVFPEKSLAELEDIINNLSDRVEGLAKMFCKILDWGYTMFFLHENLLKEGVVSSTSGVTNQDEERFVMYRKLFIVFLITHFGSDKGTCRNCNNTGFFYQIEETPCSCVHGVAIQNKQKEK
ncbi:hypothetical protein [Vibrio phage RYC]|nr:hypothetical protein [Vibrio phage RYC]